MKIANGLCAAAVAVAGVVAITPGRAGAQTTLVVERVDLLTIEPLDNVQIADFFYGTRPFHIDFEGPWSHVDDGGSYYDLGAVADTYYDLGVRFSPEAGFCGGQNGFGYLSPTTVVGSPKPPQNGPFEFTIVDPATGNPSTRYAVGMILADGDVNEIVISFYDLDDNLITQFSGFKSSNCFAGVRTTTGIHRVTLSNYGKDDYFIDDLVLGGCLTDIDGDGFVTGVDFDLYVQYFEAGEPIADFDHDGFVTGIDFDLFVQAFEAGC